MCFFLFQILDATISTKECNLINTCVEKSTKQLHSVHQASAIDRSLQHFGSVSSSNVTRRHGSVRHSAGKYSKQMFCRTLTTSSHFLVSQCTFGWLNKHYHWRGLLFIDTPTHLLWIHSCICVFQVFIVCGIFMGLATICLYCIAEMCFSPLQYSYKHKHHNWKPCQRHIISELSEHLPHRKFCGRRNIMIILPSFSDTGAWLKLGSLVHMWVLSSSGLCHAWKITWQGAHWERLAQLWITAWTAGRKDEEESRLSASSISISHELQQCPCVEYNSNT